MRDHYPKHGRRWTPRHPFRWICRCGMAAYPCVVDRMVARAELGDPERLYAEGLAYARAWQAAQRRRWWGRSR